MTHIADLDPENRYAAERQAEADAAYWDTLMPWWRDVLDENRIAEQDVKDAAADVVALDGATLIPGTEHDPTPDWHPSLEQWEYELLYRDEPNY